MPKAGSVFDLVDAQKACALPPDEVLHEVKILGSFEFRVPAALPFIQRFQALVQEFKDHGAVEVEHATIRVTHITHRESLYDIKKEITKE